MAFWLILGVAAVGVGTAIAVKAGWVVQREPSMKAARMVAIMMFLVALMLMAVTSYAQDHSLTARGSATVAAEIEVAYQAPPNERDFTARLARERTSARRRHRRGRARRLGQHASARR